MKEYTNKKLEKLQKEIEEIEAKLGSRKLADSELKILFAHADKKNTPTHSQWTSEIRGRATYSSQRLRSSFKKRRGKHRGEREERGACSNAQQSERANSKI